MPAMSLSYAQIFAGGSLTGSAFLIYYSHDCGSRHNDHLLDQAIGHVVLYPVLIVRTDGSWCVVEDRQHVLLHVLNAG